MTALYVVLAIGAFLVLLWAMISVMNRINQSERREIERQRRAWIANGCIPEEEPRFYLGPQGT
jgi:hypothetical protein